MVKKLKSTSENKSSPAAGLLDSALAGSVKDSAQQIWLAGMGAFSKAQAEGGKVKSPLACSRHLFSPTAEAQRLQVASRRNLMRVPIPSPLSGSMISPPSQSRYSSPARPTNCTCRPRYR